MGIYHDAVINAQTDEITLMSNWLSARRQPVPQPNPEGMTMPMGGEQPAEQPAHDSLGHDPSEIEAEELIAEEFEDDE